jgi:hypothetical protein
MHDLMFGTIQAILTDDLGLVKKPLGPQAVVNRPKQERVECSSAFLDFIWRQSLAVLNNIETMDKSAISFPHP